MEKVWHIDDPEEISSSIDRPLREYRAGPKQKNPAIAFSLSLVVWGGGQLYNRDWKLGFLLLLLMANFWAFLCIAVSSWQVLTSDFRPYLSPANLLFAGWVFIVFALLVWLSSAFQAYRYSHRGRATQFVGVEKRLLPPLCSFFIPGWGQLLNGQTKKGALSLIASVLLFSSILSVFALLLVWPKLEPSPTRAILEWNFALSLVIMPFLVLIWLVSIFDAFKVSFDELKKEPWLKRISYARNRLRIKGWRNTVFRRARITFPLVLILVLAVSAGSRFFPASYYESFAQRLSAELSGRDMVIVPHVLNRFLEENSE